MSEQSASSAAASTEEATFTDAELSTLFVEAVDDFNSAIERCLSLRERRPFMEGLTHLLNNGKVEKIRKIFLKPRKARRANGAPAAAAKASADGQKKRRGRPRKVDRDLAVAAVVDRDLSLPQIGAAAGTTSGSKKQRGSNVCMTAGGASPTTAMSHMLMAANQQNAASNGYANFDGGIPDLLNIRHMHQFMTSMPQHPQHAMSMMMGNSMGLSDMGESAAMSALYHQHMNMDQLDLQHQDEPTPEALNAYKFIKALGDGLPHVADSSSASKSSA